MRGVISTSNRHDKLIAKACSIPKMDGTDLAKVVSTKPHLRLEMASARTCRRSRRRERTSRRAST